MKPDSSLKAHFRKYETFLNRRMSEKRVDYEINEERLLTKSLIHDLATPLSSARAAFQILEEGVNSKHKNNEILTAGKTSIESAVKLLNELRTIERTKDRKSIFNVSKVMKNAIQILHSKASRNRIQITLEEKDIVFINSYRVTLNRILLNIINNSVEELQQCNKPIKLIEINSYLENETLIISIRDNGRGMSATTMKDIFKLGVSDKKLHSGIGLHFVKETLKTKMNGTISIDSVPEEYTEVFLKLKGICKK